MTMLNNAAAPLSDDIEKALANETEWSFDVLNLERITHQQ
jgi:hypothetical protein